MPVRVAVHSALSQPRMPSHFNFSTPYVCQLETAISGGVRMTKGPCGRSSKHGHCTATHAMPAGAATNSCTRMLGSARHCSQIGANILQALRQLSVTVQKVRTSGRTLAECASRIILNSNRHARRHPASPADADPPARLCHSHLWPLVMRGAPGLLAYQFGWTATGQNPAILRTRPQAHPGSRRQARPMQPPC